MADENTPVKAPTDIPKKSWLWIKDTAGYPSVTVTFLTVAFWVTTLSYVLSLIDHIGGVQFRAFDVAACSAYFIPLATLYFSRRFTDVKFGVDASKVDPIKKLESVALESLGVNSNKQ